MEIMEKVRNMAHEQAKKLTYKTGTNPIEVLLSIKFNFKQAQTADQDEMIKANLSLADSSCLGRVAQAGAIIEKLFPLLRLEFGEIWQDRLASWLIEDLAKYPKKKLDPGFMQELLMYEEPHAVLVIEGVQFEPLSNVLEIEINHPRVQSFPLWEGIASSYLVSLANTQTNQTKRLSLLDQAEKICPNTTLVKENQCESLESLGKLTELKDNLSWLLERRPVARTLYCAYLITKNPRHYQLLIEKYSEEAIKYF
jgi:hypothetical protein